MPDPFLGEIRLAAFGYAPQGWMACNGQILSIAQNQALFSLLGTTYGGDGRTTFALPNLQGRVPVGVGPGHEMAVTPGQTLGEDAHTLALAEMPAHSHSVHASTAPPALASPAGALWTSQTSNAYTGQANGLMAPSAVAPTGGNQAHTNLQPYQVVGYIIAIQGIYPSRN